MTEWKIPQEFVLPSGALPDPVWFQIRICRLVLNLDGKSGCWGVWLHCMWILQFLPVDPVTQDYQLQFPFKIKLKLVCGLHWGKRNCIQSSEEWNTRNFFVRWNWWIISYPLLVATGVSHYKFRIIIYVHNLQDILLLKLYIWSY